MNSRWVSFTGGRLRAGVPVLQHRLGHRHRGRRDRGAVQSGDNRDESDVEDTERAAVEFGAGVRGVRPDDQQQVATHRTSEYTIFTDTKNYLNY